MLQTSTLPFGWSNNKWSLILANIVAGILFIVLSHTGVLPIEPVNFFFFSFLGLLFSLYRPGWTFLLLIGMLPYEIINIAPQGISFVLRPYQWLLVFLLISLGIRFVLRRFPLEKLSLTWFDASLIVFTLASLLSAILSDGKIVALKLSLILFSFLLLYFVTRLFVRSIEDVKMILPFLFSSFIVVAFFALIQNILFISGKESYEVMAGRPNAVFAEADWIGFYIACIIVLFSSLLLYCKENRVFRMFISGSLILGYSVLLITVSRSAWLATVGGMMTLFLTLFFRENIWQALKEKNTTALIRFFSLKASLVVPFFIAIIGVSLFSLSPFDLLDRTKSTATGEQKITVSCEEESTLSLLPERIQTIDELSSFHCKHILLEEIDTERVLGRFVSTVYRNDPNVHIRKDIYIQVKNILKEHPFFGIGFGNIASFLGNDGRGAGLNASNIFLEIWLGSGIVGLCAFLFFWLGTALHILVRIIRKRSLEDSILLSLWVTITIFNFFNSGLFLGFFFVFLACLMLTFYDHE